MLGFQRALDILVEFLLGAGGLSSVEVAATSDATIRGAEVQRRRDHIEISKREELHVDGDSRNAEIPTSDFKDTVIFVRAER